MTISSLAKLIVGVNRMVVENVEIEYPEVTIHGKKIGILSTRVDWCIHQWFFHVYESNSSTVYGLPSHNRRRASFSFFSF